MRGLRISFRPSAILFFVLLATANVAKGAGVSVPLEDSFYFLLNGVERRGLFDERCGGMVEIEKSVQSNRFERVRGDAFPRDASTTERRVRIDKDANLKIVSERTTYPDYPVVESVVWFENISPDANTPNIKSLLAADVLLKTGGAPNLTSGCGEDPDPKRNYSQETNELPVGEKRVFTPREEAYSSFGAFPYFLLEGSERSYIIAIGWTGNWTASFEADKSGSVRFTAGQKDVDLYLKPGEKIRTPRITLFEFPTGTDSINLWRDWFRRYIMPRENGIVLRPKLALDVFYTGELYNKVTAEEQIDAIRKFRALGYCCEALWVDAGWYLRKDAVETPVGFWFGTGDWTPDPERFPNGFRPVVDELENAPEGERKGKLVLWFEPERVHKSKLTDELKKYVVPNCEIIESYRMNLADDAVVEYMSKTIGDALVSNGVSIYRQDSNGLGPDVFLKTLERDDPNFNDRKGYAENKYVCGLYEFWGALKRRVPGLIFDSCASGGRRNDLEMLRLGAVPLHYSDVGYYEFVEKQHYHDTLNRWFIYYKNIDQLDYDDAKGQYDLFKTTVDLAPFTTVRPFFFEKQSPENRNYVDRYLAVRDLMVDGDYFLLRGNMTDSDWCVWQFDDSRKPGPDGKPVSSVRDAVKRYAKDAPLISSSRQTGCVVCVRNEKNTDETIVVKPRAIDPAATYSWTNLETRQTETISGLKLSSEGVAVSAPTLSGAAFKYARID